MTPNDSWLYEKFFKNRILFVKKRFYYVLESGEVREREKRNINVLEVYIDRLPLTCPSGGV